VKEHVGKTTERRQRTGDRPSEEEGLKRIHLGRSSLETHDTVNDGEKGTTLGLRARIGCKGGVGETGRAALPVAHWAKLGEEMEEGGMGSMTSHATILPIVFITTERAITSGSRLPSVVVSEPL
jgi:hypothetical protein